MDQLGRQDMADIELEPNLQQIFQLLKEVFSISESQCKVYLTILTNDGLTAREIASLINLPRTGVYSHIQKLLEKQLIEEKSLPPKVFFAKNPREITQRIKEIKRKETEIVIEKLDHLEKQLLQLWEASSAQPLCFPTMLLAPSSFNEMAHDVDVSTKRLWIAVIAKGGTNPWPELTSSLIDAIRRGVDVKYYTSVKFIQEILPTHFSRISEVQIPVYFSAKIPFNLILIDNKAYLLLEDRTIDHYQFYSTSHPELVSGFETLFSSLA